MINYIDMDVNISFSEGMGEGIGNASGLYLAIV
jgi:hypothetical protein